MRSPAPIIRLAFCAAVMLLGAVPASAAAPQLPPAAREMAAELGFDAAANARLQDGEIVTAVLTEASSKEVALAVAMVVPLGPERIYRELVNGRFFEINRAVRDLGELPEGDISAQDLVRLELPARELGRLRSVRPGSEFNLSKTEIEALRATTSDAETGATYRRLLAARANTYRAGGAAALPPYARGRSKTARPGDDLGSSVLALSHLDARAPDFYRFLRDYPNHSAPKLYQRFFWSTQDIQDRPTAILSHWVMQLHPDYALAAERQFYVGHSYNALQVSGGAFALDEGRSLVFYTNRTATDQIASFPGPAARSIARRMMLKQIVGLFEGIRSAIESGVPPSR